MNRRTKISITIISIVILLFGIIQVAINAADNIAPQIAFYEKPGQILKGKKAKAYITDDSGIANIKYCWDNEINSGNIQIIPTDPVQTVVEPEFSVPEENGVHILWMKVMDKFENETPWTPMCFYVVDS